MRTTAYVVTTAVLTLFAAHVASAATTNVDINRLVNLTPGQVFQWRQVNPLDSNRFSDNTVKCVVSTEPGNAGRLRLNLYETGDGLDDWFFASLIVGKSSTGVTLYEESYGATPEDVRDYEVICDGGLLWPRYMAPNQETHVVAIFTNGAGIKWWNNGATRALYTGDVGLYKGCYFLSLETGFGASCSLLLKPGVGVVGCEFSWNVFLSETLQ
jgi:hypothetical protein